MTGAASSSHGRVTIPVDSLATSFEDMLVDDQLTMSSRVCIFKVPIILRRHNPQAYEPNAFSIGPFHYGNDKLKPTQKIKLKYLQGLLHRRSSPHCSRQEVLSQLIRAVREIEREARECYAAPIETVTVEKFVEILVLDGCFIIELLRKDSTQEVTDSTQVVTDPIFSMSCLREFLNHDLILLENQIPWLVLECLFNMTGKESTGKSLIQLALNFFSKIFSSVNRPTYSHSDSNPPQIKHILDLLRLSLLSSGLIGNESQNWEPFPCARKIKDSGIKFRKVSSNTVLDIKFSNGFLDIPPLLVHETTESIFRNLISFEQCCPNYSPIITCYAKLMDNLIDTTKDVEILCENNVLDIWLTPEDATGIFNKLYNDTYVQKFYYHEVCQGVNSYSKKWWPKWRYIYVHNYFTTPWAIVSQVAAAIFLVLGLLQTYYTIASYQSQNKKP